MPNVHAPQPEDQSSAYVIAGIVLAMILVLGVLVQGPSSGPESTLGSQSTTVDFASIFGQPSR